MKLSTIETCVENICIVKKIVNFNKILYNFLSRFLRGKAFTYLVTIVVNRLSMIIKNVLINIKASGYLFINLVFARKL